MKKTVIAFFGPDGAGKTTLAKLLTIYLLSKGYPVYKFWIRGLHTFALLVAIFLSYFQNMKGDDIPTLRIKIKYRNFWCFLEIVSLIPIIFKFIIYKKLNSIILSERCIVDSIVWLRTLYGDNKLCRFFTNILFKLLLNYYDYIIYIFASPDIINIRRRFEKIPIYFLHTQIKYYNLYYRLLKKYYKGKLCFIDTSNEKVIESYKKLLVCIQELVVDTI